MSPPKKLHLPSSPAPLPPSQERRVLATGLSSMLVAGLALGSVTAALLLFPIVSNLVVTHSPVQVVSTPSIDPYQENEESTSQQRLLPRTSTPPSPPTRQAKGTISTHPPRLDSQPNQAAPTHQSLSSQSSSSLEFLVTFSEEEEARIEELVQKEFAAKAQALRKQLEESKLAKELAKKQEQEAAERAREQQKLATLNAEKKRQQAALAKEATASKQRQALASKVATAPSVISKKLPRYPSSARRAGWEGTTRITATVSPKGKISSAYISQSSGHPSLDKTALAAVKRWRFSPARNGLGEAISHQVVLPIPFRLN